MVIKEFAISPYVISFIAALTVSFLVVYILTLKRGISPNLIGYSIFLNIFLILYFAKMYTVIVGGFQVTFLNAGPSSLGGAIGLLMGIFIFGCIYREGRKVFFESYVAVIPLMYGIAKIGCYLTGCCHGITYTGIGAVCYENRMIQGGPYFPVQLLESVVFYVIFVVGFFLWYRKKSKYTVPGIILLCAITKFSMEYLREEHKGKLLSMNQMVCIGFAVWAVALIFIKKEKISWKTKELSSQ